MRVLRARRNSALCDFSRQRPTAASEPPVGRQPHVDDHTGGHDPPPHSLVCFAEESLRPTPGASEIISFSVAGDDDLDEAMSLMASEKDWAHSPEEHSEVEGNTAFQDEIVRILTKAVSDLCLEWESPDEPAKSKLDSWLLHSGRHSEKASPIPP